MMFPKRLLAFLLLIALALIGAGEARAQWEKINSPPATSGTLLAASGDRLFFGTIPIVYVSTDNGMSWDSTSSALTGNGASGFSTIGTNLFIFTFPGNVFRSTDSGSTWSADTLRDVWCFVTMGTNMFAATGGPVFKSTDSGVSWFDISGPLKGWLETNYDLNGGYDHVIVQLAVVGTDLYASLEPDYTGESGACTLVSTDSGKSWSQISNNPSSIGVYGQILMFGGNGDTVYTDGNEASLGPSIYAFPQTLTGWGSYLFLGTAHGGVLLSSDTGKSWISIKPVLAENFIDGLAICENYLLALTPDGIYRRPLSDFGISSVSQTPVAATSEVHVYPNPFSNSTTISFTSESSGFAEVSIVNALGAEVAHLYSGELAAGEHSFTWSDPSIRNGMYECLVRMNGTVQIAGIIVLH
jgi:photosystem II stability/assembly factor-like uncharacterized protein